MKPKCFISRQVLGKTSSYSEGYCFDFDMGLSDEYEISPDICDIVNEVTKY